MEVVIFFVSEVFYLSFRPQSSDCTVFFFTVGEKYNPIGFVQVPGPVQGLEWSPHSHVSLIPGPSLLSEGNITDLTRFRPNISD